MAIIHRNIPPIQGPLFRDIPRSAMPTLLSFSVLLLPSLASASLFFFFLFNAYARDIGMCLCASVVIAIFVLFLTIVFCYSSILPEVINCWPGWKLDF